MPRLVMCLYHATHIYMHESQQLTDMGFPEDQARAALRAAMGNADMAVEFLMNGIPEGMPPAAGTVAAHAC
jgi:uncharacterized UBP type Zn finger protein